MSNATCGGHELITKYFLKYDETNWRAPNRKKTI